MGGPDEEAATEEDLDALEQAVEELERDFPYLEEDPEELPDDQGPTEGEDPEEGPETDRVGGPYPRGFFSTYPGQGDQGDPYEDTGGEG